MQKTERLYRLTRKENHLPTHWAYADAWEWESYTWVDKREAGFQCFGSPINAYLALIGDSGTDGVYTASDYCQILQVEVDSDYVYDGSSDFFAVSPGGLIAAKSIGTSDFIDRVQALFELEKSIYGYEYDRLEDWLSDSEEEDLEQIFNKVAEDVTTAIVYVNTLPIPPA